MVSELSEEDYIDTYDEDNGSEMSYYESGKERNGNERENVRRCVYRLCCFAFGINIL